MSYYIIFLHLFHIILIGGLFIYVGIKKTSLKPNFYNFLFGLGIFLFIYHGYKTYQKIINKKNPWINLFHMFIVSPLLVYIGSNKGKVNNMYYELLLMLGFAAIGYHGYYLYLDIQM